MACDVIGYVRNDAKEIQMIQQQKRTGSASARVRWGRENIREHRWFFQIFSFSVDKWRKGKETNLFNSS